jgi:type II secretory pathway pseudopilin PulG
MRERVEGSAAGGAHGCRCGGSSGARGASLVEIVVVLALGSVLLGAAWPALAGLLDTVELRSATLRFGAAVARGRVAALTEGRTWRLRLAGVRDFVLAPLGDDAAPPERLPGSAFFAGATSGGDVRFFASGLVDNATFILGAGDARRRVVVNQRGKVTVE